MVTAKYPAFAEVRIAQIVEMAQREQCVEIQVPVHAVWDDGKKAVHATVAGVDACITTLSEQLWEHAVWNKGFVPYDFTPSGDSAIVSVTDSNGVSRIVVWRFGNAQEVAECLNLLLDAVRQYREFANALIRSLAQQLGVDVNEFAISYNWTEHKSRGMLEEQVMGHSWGYFFHGVDCCFGSDELRTQVEVRLGCGDDFGVIERHFFWRFLSSYVRKEPRFLPLVERIHETKRAWAAGQALRDGPPPDVLPFLLTLLERRGLLRCITAYNNRPWDWLLIDSVYG